MAFRIQPIPYFVGLAIGFIALSWLGAKVESAHLIDGFVRFHQLIIPEFYYFPTARQVLSIVNAPAQPPPKVYVIVGGSSVFNGVGQDSPHVWTRDLQARLGPDYRVLNFAQRAGGPSDFGNIAAEWLIMQSRPVIYLADGTLGNFDRPLEASFYRHIIFDAWQRGYLLSWPPRDRLLSTAIWKGPEALRIPAIGALLNSFLNFNDLWQYVGYEYAGLIWIPLLNEQSFEPRRSLPDPEWPPEKYVGRGYPGPFEDGLKIIKNRIHPLDDPIWGILASINDQMLPPRLRAVTLAVLRLDTPHYWSHLDASDRNLIFAGLDKFAALLTNLGFHKTLIVSENYTEDDYVDWVHLSVSGGRKLSADVAPAVRAMAQELGYVQ